MQAFVQCLHSFVLRRVAEQQSIMYGWPPVFTSTFIFLFECIYNISIPAVEPLSETVSNDHCEEHQPGGIDAFQYD